MSAMDELCATEIEELHHFFEAWLTGRSEKSEAVFARCRNVLADGFQHVNPSGRATDRDALCPFTPTSARASFWGSMGVLLHRTRIKRTWASISMPSGCEATGFCGFSRAATSRRRSYVATTNSSPAMIARAIFLPVACTAEEYTNSPNATRM